MTGRIKKVNNINVKLAINNELKSILDIYLGKKGTTISNELEEEMQFALEKVITKFVPKDVQILLEEMNLIERKPKNKSKNKSKDREENSLKNKEENGIKNIEISSINDIKNEISDGNIEKKNTINDNGFRTDNNNIINQYNNH